MSRGPTFKAHTEVILLWNSSSSGFERSIITVLSVMHVSATKVTVGVCVPCSPATRVVLVVISIVLSAVHCW